MCKAGVYIFSIKSCVPPSQWFLQRSGFALSDHVTSTGQDKPMCQAGSWCCQGHLLHCLHQSLQFCFLWLWPTWYMCLLTLSSTSICTFWTSLSCYCGWHIAEFVFVALQVRRMCRDCLKAEGRMKLIWSWGFMWTWSIKNLCFLKPNYIPTP